MNFKKYLHISFFTQIQMAKVLQILIILIPLFTNLYPQAAKEEYEKASLFLSQEKYSEAILALNSSLKKNPYYKEAYNKLGFAYYQKGEYKSAIISFKKAIAQDKSYTEAINNLGLAYEKDGKINNAIKSYKIAIEQEPTNPEFHYNLAGCLYKKGLIFDSIKEYKKTIEIEPSFYLAHIRLGDIYWKDKKMKDEAIMFYEDAKAKNPKSPLPHKSLGRLYFQSKETNKAIWEYKKAISKNKHPINELMELGRIYIEKGDYKEAEKIYKRLEILTPQEKIVKFCLGLIYEKEKMYPSALSSYENALSIEKEDEVSQFSKERIILELSKEPVHSKKRKDSSLLHFKLSENYLKEGMIPLAIYEHKKAISLNPLDINTRLSLARVYENNEMFSEAEQEITKIIELEPSNIEASDGIERITFKKKKTICFQEKIDDIPNPDVRVSFFGIFSKEPLSNPDSLNYLNYLLTNLFSNHKKLNLLENLTESFYDKKTSIELAKGQGADFLLFAEVKEENERIKIDAKLINLENLKEENIISQAGGNNRLKEAVYYLSEKVGERLPIRGKIFKIKEDNVFINIGNLSGIKEQEVLGIFENRKIIGKIKVIKVNAGISKAIILPPQTKDVLKIGKEVRRITN